MKLKTLPFALIASGVSLSVPATAAWLDNNLRDGLTNFGVSATVSPTFSHTASDLRYLAGDDRVREALIGQDIEETDERIRLINGDAASVWINAYQNLTRNTTISANVGLYGRAPTETYKSYPAVAYSYGVNLTNEKIGSLRINSGSNFSTSAIGVSGTYNELDVDGSAVSAILTRIPNFRLATYYAFPSASNVRLISDTGIHHGHGVMASYVYSFNPRHEISGAIGYTQSKRNANISSNSLVKDKKATGIGLSYQYLDWQFSADYTTSDNTLGGSYIDNVDIDTLGFRVDYEINPRFNVYASYGERTSKKAPSTGRSLGLEEFITANRAVTETNVFGRVEQKRYTIGADYEIYPGVDINATIRKTDTKNHLSDTPFSEREALSYSAGVSFSF